MAANSNLTLNTRARPRESVGVSSTNLSCFYCRESVNEENKGCRRNIERTPCAPLSLSCMMSRMIYSKVLVTS